MAQKCSYSNDVKRHESWAPQLGNFFKSTIYWVKLRSAFADVFKIKPSPSLWMIACSFSLFYPAICSLSFDAISYGWIVQSIFGNILSLNVSINNNSRAFVYYSIPDFAVWKTALEGSLSKTAANEAVSRRTNFLVLNLFTNAVQIHWLPFESLFRSLKPNFRRSMLPIEHLEHSMRQVVLFAQTHENP